LIETIAGKRSGSMPLIVAGASRSSPLPGRLAPALERGRGRPLNGLGQDGPATGKDAVNQPPVEVSFYYNQRIGDRARRDAAKPLKHEPGQKPGFYRVQLPKEAGPTKIYAFVRDSFPNLSIAHASVKVE